MLDHEVFIAEDAEVDMAAIINSKPPKPPLCPMIRGEFLSLMFLFCIHSVGCHEFVLVSYFGREVELEDSRARALSRLRSRRSELRRCSIEVTTVFLKAYQFLY